MFLIVLVNNNNPAKHLKLHKITQSESAVHIIGGSEAGTTNSFDCF